MGLWMTAVVTAAALLAMAASTAAYNNGVGATPPMGWSTWCTDDPFCSTDFCDEAEVRSVADALVSTGLASLGYDLVLLDDCWANYSRTADGKLAPLPSTFPSGIPALVQYLNARGLRLGLYTDVGGKTCRRGRPGSFGHYATDAATFVEWGVEYVKIDNCARPANHSEIDLYSAFSHAFNATGVPVELGACEWGDSNPEAWAADYVQAYRVACDHLPFWEFPPYAAGDCWGQGVREMIEFMAYKKPSSFVKQYGWADTDFLMTTYTPTMSHADSRTEFSMWAMWSAPLVVATDIRHSKERVDILSNTEVLAIHHDPLWHAADMVANSTHGHIWARPLANGDVAVALLNFDPFLPRSIKFSFATVGWPPSAPATLRDLWAHKDIGVHSNAFAADVGPHDVLLLRMSKPS